MDDWTMTDTLELCDRIAEEKANAEFISACQSSNLKKIEFELQHGRDPNLPVLGKAPLWYARNDTNAVKLLLTYGADPGLCGFYVYCRKFFKDELLELCNPYMTDIVGRDIFKRLQNGRNELKKRYDLCCQNDCRTVMEYNQTTTAPFKRYFLVFPFIHTLHEEEQKILCDIANKGRAADIHVAVGSTDEKLPSDLAMCCQEKISAPVGANTLLHWYCPCYSVNIFQ